MGHPNIDLWGADLGLNKIAGEKFGSHPTKYGKKYSKCKK